MNILCILSTRWIVPHHPGLLSFVRYEAYLLPLGPQFQWPVTMPLGRRAHRHQGAAALRRGLLI